MIRAWGWDRVSVSQFWVLSSRYSLQYSHRSSFIRKLRSLFEFLWCVQVSKHVGRELATRQLGPVQNSNCNFAKQGIDLVLPLPQCLFGQIGERLSIDGA